MVYSGIRTILISIFLILVSATCSEPPNNDVLEERSCTEAGGTWLISRVQCNGTVLEQTPFSAVTFDDSDIMTWKVGSADCQSSVDNVYQIQNAKLDIFGLSFFQCSANGTELNACSGTQTSCDSSVPGSVHSQEFPECVISYGSLKLTRILSEDQVTNGFSFCPEAGQIEEIFYTAQSEDSAALSFSTGNGFGFDSLLPGENQLATITITNRGATDATNIRTSLAAPFSFPGDGYPGIDGSCSSTIPAFSTCDIVVQFAPKEVGAFSENVEFRFNNGSGDVSTFFLLSGSGKQPLGQLVLLTGAPIEFGNQTAGTSTVFFAKFENVGTGFARGFTSTRPQAPFFITGDQFPGINGNCGKIVGRNQVCEVELEFRPAGPGIFSSKMVFRYDNGVGRIETEVELKGSAVTAGP